MTLINYQSSHQNNKRRQPGETLKTQSFANFSDTQSDQNKEHMQCLKKTAVDDEADILYMESLRKILQVAVFSMLINKEVT